jgi:hypothetical protein
MVVASNNAIQEQKRRKKLMLQKASISWYLVSRDANVAMNICT